MICSGLNRQQCNELYAQVMGDEDVLGLQRLAKDDLWFLLTVACKRKDMNKPGRSGDWLFDRCREVEASPDGNLDLWARDHYKSTIITFGLTIKDILNDPEATFGIFSHTRPISKAFLEQIKREFEQNSFLHELFPETLFKEPEKEADKWSLDGGIIVKRKTNPKECTIEANGLVDGQPTSRHYSHQIYDDVVTMESVSTPEQIKKTTQAWEMSLNLGSGSRTKIRYIGTRYHLFDTYDEMMKRTAAKPRLHKATHNGKLPTDTEEPGQPVFLDEATLLKKRREMGPYTFGSQMLQNPVADKAMSFKLEWIRYFDLKGRSHGWNYYLLVDPASKKKSSNDYTSMEVHGLAPDGNYYLVDGLRDRLNLTQRAAKVFEFHRKWMPVKVGYESYGLQADIEHIQYEMEQQNYRFEIVELGGSMPKEDRIRRLVPVYEQGRFYTPRKLVFVDYEGVARDYILIVEKEEYHAFPVSTHDDCLDCRSRILDPDLGAKFPRPQARGQVQTRALTGDE